MSADRLVPFVMVSFPPAWQPGEGQGLNLLLIFHFLSSETLPQLLFVFHDTDPFEDHNPSSIPHFF